MPSLLVQAPDMGINTLLPESMRDPRESGDDSQNILYRRGLLKTPYGFARLGMTAGALNSGDTVLSIFPFRELNNTHHLIAVTTEKIYDHDTVNEEWDDKTKDGGTMSSNIYKPISYVELGHDDTDIYLDDDNSRSKVYYHLIVCDGGLSDIQRWAGYQEADFANVTGGGDYHDGTTHRAGHIGAFKSRIILLSPRTYDSSSKTWTKHNQRVRWPTIGKLQTWTGTGSGFSDLVDTGDINVWAAPLAGQYIIYQKHSIWALNYVGGTDIFKPRVLLTNLGLLAPHLMIAKNNVHYFVGDDYNVYAYYGGGLKERIGDKIHKFLLEDLAEEYGYRCWMSMGAQGSRLWIFVVPSGSSYITKAYGRDMITGNWMVRDYSSKWASGGITAVNLVGAQSYTIGDTYQEALDLVSTAQADITSTAAADVTLRYGDTLLDTSRSLTADYTIGTWEAGGFAYTKIGEPFTTDFTENDIMVVFDGSEAANVKYGTHYYTVYDVSANSFRVRPTQGYVVGESTATGDTGISDCSTDTPGDLSVDGQDTIGFYSVCSEDSPGTTYRQNLEEARTEDRMVLGDNGGFVYQYDDSLTTEDGVDISAAEYRKVEDWGEPDKFKRWPGISIVAKEKTSGNGKVVLGYALDSTTFTDFTSQVLTSDWQEYGFPLNKTSKAIQPRFANISGSDFEIKSYTIWEPLIESDR